ncbi:MBOAT family O-acyltransferase [Geomonas oryzae]|uniref:MBOAT family O-acyltransferase n=1 Tax=Geomonas oryzae TaxID=2364273 RepID=UPI00100B0F92|nr:MBOAT family O-acyltransferase [Geomonas oryzae]
MDFTGPVFLFLFLPALLCVYWMCHPAVRTTVLLGASLFFYAWNEGRYVLLLCLAIALNYLLILSMDRCQMASRRLAALFATITANLLFLFSFKYPVLLQWFTSNLGINPSVLAPVHLPLGISFFIFQAIAYAVDVYRRKHAALANPLKFSLFLSLFPKISAGPIIRYEEVESSLACPKIDMDECAYGAKRFIIGMGKKLLIADTLAKTSDQIFAINAGELTAPLAWLGIICYTLQLYFDFAGYSDMAIGLGRMLGFSFRENFDYPYTAKSITEFWRRWHLSLSTWFRDYLYTPLLYSLMTEKVRQKIALGRYRTNYRSMFCIIVVFTLCGWWHGATWNYVVWGLLHGIILALESWKLNKVLKKAPFFLSHAYALCLIMFCWVFFRCQSLSDALSFIKAMSGFASGHGQVYSVPLYLNSELLLVLGIAILSAVPSTRLLRERFLRLLPALSRGWSVAAFEAGALTVVFLLCLLSVASSTYKPFIYFRF